VQLDGVNLGFLNNNPSTSSALGVEPNPTSGLSTGNTVSTAVLLADLAGLSKSISLESLQVTIEAAFGIVV